MAEERVHHLVAGGDFGPSGLGVDDLGAAELEGAVEVHGGVEPREVLWPERLEAAVRQIAASDAKLEGDGAFGGEFEGPGGVRGVEQGRRRLEG